MGDTEDSNRTQVWDCCKAPGRYLVVVDADVVVALQLRSWLQPCQSPFRVRVAVMQQHQLHPPVSQGPKESFGIVE